MRKLTMAELGRLSPAEFTLGKRIPLAVVLDNVRSALNVGSVFRTADAFAVTEIQLCGITATPPHREILKTALGATATVPWHHSPDTLGAVRGYRQAGYRVLSVEQAEGAVPLYGFVPDLTEKYALVFGNEVEGVSENVMREVDACLEIPQFGTKHSLNVAVAVGIVCWHFASRFRFGQENSGTAE
ncbi:MAG: hypothetical protein RLY31_2721 [Bacteroidota bacterium]|jgi:tRNA G18 (ribose-2'-O)-methylase SpoU